MHPIPVGAPATRCPWAARRAATPRAPAADLPCRSFLSGNGWVGVRGERHPIIEADAAPADPLACLGGSHEGAFDENQTSSACRGGRKAGDQAAHDLLSFSLRSATFQSEPFPMAMLMTTGVMGCFGMTFAGLPSRRTTSTFR